LLTLARYGPLLTLARYGPLLALLALLALLTLLTLLARELPAAAGSELCRGSATRASPGVPNCGPAEEGEHRQQRPGSGKHQPTRPTTSGLLLSRRLHLHRSNPTRLTVHRPTRPTRTRRTADPAGSLLRPAGRGAW
jgi:hypothetical protein